MASLIPVDIRTLLAKTLEFNPEDHVRVLYFLSKCKAEGVAEIYITSLQSVMKTEDVFKEFLVSLAQMTKTAENNPVFTQTMKNICKNFLKCFDFESVQLALPEMSFLLTVENNFMQNIAGLPEETHEALSNIIHKIGCTDTTVFRVVVRWWIRTCEKFVKNNTNLIIYFAIAGEVGDFVLSARFERPIETQETMIRLLLGCIRKCESSLRGFFSFVYNISYALLNLPESEALENAFNVLGVSPTASDSDVRSAYRRLALRHHPDKNGSSEKFLQISKALTVVKTCRHTMKYNE